MNNYHVYEAIGLGKHSTVYKGRMKKSIEYFAIKSADKSQRSKLLQEVKMLHGLDHPNILKFYSWYESSAHLWMIMEYCVGGDLMSLLREDARLPEESIHDLAHDIIKALQYLHFKGIIYCDLKPSNILLDENGHIKLCDFGLASRLSAIEESSHTTVPQPKRGTPCYMAPELFKDGGVNSYASDFWALGCVLYECYAGRPPFVGNEFTKLANSILLDPTPDFPGKPSDSFVDLVTSLLMKDPAERLDWHQLCEHRFWQTKFNFVSLPQPAFSNRHEQSAKLCLTERIGERPSQQRTPTKANQRNATGTPMDDNSSTQNKSTEMPLKSGNVSRKLQNRTAQTAANGKQNVAKNILKGVNLLRLSRVAKLNLQRENEKENYRRHMTSTHGNDAEVKIDNNDLELDFSEIPEDDAPDESGVSENHGSSPSEESPNLNNNQKTEETELDAEHQVTTANDIPALPGDENKHEQDSYSEKSEINKILPGIYVQRKGQQNSTTAATAPDSEPSAISSKIFEILWHPSDLSVRPVMPSRKAIKVSDAMPSLSFKVVPACEYVKLLPDQLSALNSQIIRGLNGSLQHLEKIIRYLEILSMNSDAANIITNGPIMLSLIKMLRHPKMVVLHSHIASLIGLLIRHSTYIEADLASSGILDALGHGLREKQDKTRRFCMAALGELMFYISTVKDSVEKDNCASESPSNDKRYSSSWKVSNSLIGLVSSVLRKGEDDVTQLYALKTIENICSQGKDWTSRFASHDIIANISYIYRATSKLENTRLIAGSCLVRLAHFCPPCIQLILEKISIKDTASSLSKGSQRTPREKQICLNLLNMAILSSRVFSIIGRHLFPLVDELVPGLMLLIEQENVVLRGKTLIFVALLCKNSRRWLPQFLCNVKLLSTVDRLVKEKDPYLQQCIEAFVQLVSSTVPGILETVSGDIQQTMGGKRHVIATAMTGRSNTKSTSDLFPAVLHLLGSPSFKHRVVSSHVLIQLANLIKLLEVPFQGRDDFQITLLQILETITEEPSAIFDDPEIFTSQILPSLAILYKGNKDGGARFLCLKILFDVMVVILNDMLDILKNEDGQVLKDLNMISESHFLPLYPYFVEDEDPIPLYAQKLLLMLLEFNYIKISDILHLKTVSQCFEFLLNDLSNANVNNVKLCLALASAPEMEAKILSNLAVVRRIGNLLEFVSTKGMEDFLVPTLALCKAFVLHAIGTNKGSAICEKPALLEDDAFSTSFDVDQQHCIQDISDFSCNMSSFLELIGSSDSQIANLASECVILLVKAAPREATMGLLANLSKITYIFNCLKDTAPVSMLLRLLYALAFSCRQYLSQAMILAISMPDVMRIEALLSDFKNSREPGISEAARILGLELQRLPHCI
ncbi:Serine/threonine-protein kinase TIO [Apostasia shenzhenica]|uniref:Serine/threonine-protein kinase TIO n=1 Tax=Apostasia shenzhenica TaxID=1088818 RepID=A0A2I0A640_9ASPA|nr:Serine/threonine-protein kinase TIO [Apostasia shenzhenica]